MITPVLIKAVGRLPHDRDLGLLGEKHGGGKVAAALTYAIPDIKGMTERVAALELPPICI